MAISTIFTRLAALNAMKGVGQPLAAATLILYSNPVAPTPQTVMGDLVECTFNGYAAVAGLAFGTPFIDTDGREKLAAPSEQFTATNGAIIETIQGWALTNVGKTQLYYAEALDVPVPISQASQGTIIEPVVVFGQ